MLLAGSGSAQEPPPPERRSGATFMRPETQALQRDEAANPALLWLGEGEALWHRPEGRAERACASCHDGPPRGVAARYPAFDEASGGPVDLAGRVNLCRARHQEAEPLPRESPALLALTAYVASFSRGVPIEDPARDLRLAPALGRGRALYTRRMGQLDLSCSGCHDLNWRERLGASPITQGQATGYPLYRLEWQSLGSLQRRMRNCLTGVRAEPFPYGAPEYVELELHLRARAAGLPIETPALRP